MQTCTAYECNMRNEGMSGDSKMVNNIGIYSMADECELETDTSPKYEHLWTSVGDLKWLGTTIDLDMFV